MVIKPLHPLLCIVQYCLGVLTKYEIKIYIYIYQLIIYSFMVIYPLNIYQLIIYSEIHIQV